MAKQPQAGDLRGLYSFQKRGDLDDGFGTIVPGAGPFAEVFKAAGSLLPARGGSEAITAGRLAGRQVYYFTFRSHVLARTVTTDWQIVDVRTAKIYKIKSPASDATQKSAYLDILVEEGAIT